MRHSQDLPAWTEPTVAALLKLGYLSADWDSYGAPPIKRSLLGEALALLTRVMTEHSPAPSIVPLHDGGVQLEWHRRSQDLEIVLCADQPPQFFYRNAETGKEIEGGMSGLSLVGSLIHNMA